MAAVDRKGNPVALNDGGQIASVRFLYDNAFGRLLLKVLTRPRLSRLAGAYLDTKLSTRLIPGFIRKNGIDMSEYEEAEYRSFNEFFCRKIRKDRRPVACGKDVLVSPADAKLTVLPITEDARFRIKNIGYTFEQLVRDPGLAEKYAGGTILIFRLTVSDYHRYGYPCSGTVSQERRIPGVLHTVHPLAAEKTALYAENARELATLETERFGTVLMMEVGALLVGRIVNDRPAGAVEKGAEKGHFEYGGSTVILCLAPGTVALDPEFTENSARGLETVVRYGERIGVACE
ncbi:MAG: phosphatidylserine decarboxylase [Clostridia bacterium]|nr:phosphatidylserine decarboxylase [Clostridia bacterium]